VGLPWLSLLGFLLVIATKRESTKRPISNTRWRHYSRISRAFPRKSWFLLDAGTRKAQRSFAEMAADLDRLNATLDAAFVQLKRSRSKQRRLA